MKALIVDDESPARERLKRLLAIHENIEIVGEAANGLQALEEIERLKPDLVFLDIEMPELNGLGVAEAIQSGGPAVVFITAYSEHALKAFEVAAIDYLVKPIVDTRLALTIKKLQDRKNAAAKNYTELLDTLSAQASRKLAIRCGAKFVVFDPTKISAILARDHYAALLVEEREFLADDSIDTLIARLSPKQFIRVHRGAAINVEFLKELEREGDRKYVAILKDKQKTKVPIARERLAGLKQQLGIK